MAGNKQTAGKNLIFMNPNDAAKIVNEMNELRMQVTETRCLVRVQANHIQKIKSTLSTLSAQVQLMVPKIYLAGIAGPSNVKKGKKGKREVETLRLKYLPINNMERFQDMHLKVTRDKDTQLASKICNELREIFKDKGGIYGDLGKCFELILTRDFCCELNWSGVSEKKPMSDNWLFKTCLPKILGVDPADKLMMGMYVSKVKAAHKQVVHRHYAQMSRKKTKEMMEMLQSTSMGQTQVEATDPLMGEPNKKKLKVNTEDIDEASEDIDEASDSE